MKRILKIIAALIGLCMVVSIIGAIFNPTKTNPAAVAPVAVATAVIVPTRTPEASTEPATATIGPTVGPTDTPIPATVAPKAFAVPPSKPDGYESGGLGLTYADFVTRHGEPEGVSEIHEYLFGPLRVWWQGEDSKAWMIDYWWPKGGFAQLDASKIEAEKLIPKDAKLTHSFVDKDGYQVYEYLSKSLADRFDEWPSRTDDPVPPGTFMIVHRIQNGGRDVGLVSSFYIGIGNN